MDEKRDKLLEETAKKLIDLVEHELDSRVLQCLLSDHISYVGDDIDLTIQLYVLVTGKLPVIPGL